MRMFHCAIPQLWKMSTKPTNFMITFFTRGNVIIGIWVYFYDVQIFKSLEFWKDCRELFSRKSTIPVSIWNTPWEMFNVFRNSHKGSSETLAMSYRKPVIKKYISLLRKQLYTISRNFSEQYFYRTPADGCKWMSHFSNKFTRS